jgi:hypothetical protein
MTIAAIPTAYVVLFHCAVAVAIFFGLNWLGRKSDMFGYETLTMFTEREDAVAFNFLFRAVTPVVILVLVAASCYALGLDRFTANLHYALVYYIVIRVLFNIARGRALLLPWRRLVFQWATTMGLATLAYNHLLTKKEYLFPDIKTVGNEVWLAIGGYMYVLANKVFADDVGASRRGARYVKGRCRLFERRFGHILDAELPSIRWRALVLAVLIVEDFNRPKPVRVFERLLFPLGAASTLGIMQVKAERNISDVESVQLGVRRLLSCYREAVSARNWRNDKARMHWGAMAAYEHEEGQIVHHTLVRYNPSGDYARDVAAIFEKVLEMMSVVGDWLHPDAPPAAACEDEPA